MTATIDLNADVGESFGPHPVSDDSLLDLLTSANLACGFHAGDPMAMEQTVRLCVDKGIAMGAHPGFRDLQGFGRRPIGMSIDEVRTDVLYQIGALHAFTVAMGQQISHVTPHGSLGNLAVTDKTYAQGIIEAVLAFDPHLPVVTQSGVLADLATENGVPVAITAMADRGYSPDGTLVSRGNPGALITDPQAVIDRVLSMVIDQTVIAVDGTSIDLTASTVLLHGDNAEAVELARGIRTALHSEGVKFAPIADVLKSGHTDER